jgi:hypothetical protein
MTDGKVSLTYIDGVAEAVNNDGLKLGDQWHKFSRPATALANVTVGQQVRLGLDGQGFIRELLVDTPLDSSSAPSVSRRDRLVSRLAVLKSASIFAASRGEQVRSSDVLKIADSWLHWVESEHAGEAPQS